MNPHQRLSLQNYQYYTLPTHHPSKKQKQQSVIVATAPVASHDGAAWTEDQVRVLTSHLDLIEAACLSGQVNRQLFAFL